MVCSVCGRWVEVKDVNPLFAFVSGLDPDSEREANERVAFVRRHLSRCGGTIEGIQEDNPRWAELDEDNREAENAR
jgi:hypothetical protein